VKVGSYQKIKTKVLILFRSLCYSGMHSLQADYFEELRSQPTSNPPITRAQGGVLHGFIMKSSSDLGISTSFQSASSNTSAATQLF
jgi:hypothetical protein